MYQEIRRHCVAVHGVDLSTYVTRQHPRGFSEFTVLGAYARERHRPMFDWVPSESEGSYPRFCNWFWSWGGLDQEVRDYLESIIGGRS